MSCTDDIIVNRTVYDNLDRNDKDRVLIHCTLQPKCPFKAGIEGLAGCLFKMCIAKNPDGFKVCLDKVIKNQNVSST